MLRLRKNKNDTNIISEGDVISFIQTMKQLAETPGSNVKGIKITRNGKNQVIALKVVASNNEMRILRKILPREKLFTLNRRF